MLKNTTNQEPKFTVEQVLIAAGNYIKQDKSSVLFDFNYKPKLSVIAAVNAILIDPDYQLYLELKSKYENV